MIAGILRLGGGRIEGLLKPTRRGPYVMTADLRLDDEQDLFDAWERWGERCPEKLIGGFAFAIWDTRRRTLFCARDHLGEKPFFYAHRPGKLFAFASRIKDLPGPREIDDARVREFFTTHGGAVLDERTYYKGILRLEAGHSLSIRDGKVRIRRYWSAAKPDRQLGRKESVEAFRETFIEAVRCRLRTRSKIAATLSGGLDSSSVASTARHLLVEQGRGPLTTVSAVYDTVPETDEREHIRKVLALGDMDPLFVHPDREGPLERIDRILDCIDEPYYAPGLVVNHLMYQAAADRGVRVLLEGIGGDDILGYGYEHLAELARSGHWGTLLLDTLRLSANVGRSPIRLLREQVVSPLTPETAKRRFRTLLGRPQPSESTSGDPGPGIPRYVPWLQEIVGGVAASFGLEIRCPFLDRRLVELCLAVPSGQILDRGRPRMIVRRALAGILPDSTRQRYGKSTLGPALRQGLLTTCREVLEAFVAGGGGKAGRFVSGKSLQEEFRLFQEGRVNFPNGIWRAYVMDKWLRRRAVQRS